MGTKTIALIVAMTVAIAGTGLAIIYHNDLFSSNETTKILIPINSTSSNNSTASEHDNNTTSNTHISDNVIVNKVQTYFKISDSQGVYENFTEQFTGFKMTAGNSTQFNISIINDNFFNITLNRIDIKSDGFDLENVTPILPVPLQSHSSKNLTLEIFAQAGMKNFQGNIYFNIYGNRTTIVSVPLVHLMELGRDPINNTSFYKNLSSKGFITKSNGRGQVIFTLHNYNTFALNFSTITSDNIGFSVFSTFPSTSFVIMPNESENLTVNITISASMAGYHNSINITLNENATLQVVITSIKLTYQFVTCTVFPSTYFVNVPSNINATKNFTVQFGLQEFCGPMDAIEITGFRSNTNGFSAVSESVLYSSSSNFPVEISCDSVGFSVTFHVSGNMAGYRGQLDIYATD